MALLVLRDGENPDSPPTLLRHPPSILAGRGRSESSPLVGLEIQALHGSLTGCGQVLGRAPDCCHLELKHQMSYLAFSQATTVPSSYIWQGEWLGSPGSICWWWWGWGWGLSLLYLAEADCLLSKSFQFKTSHFARLLIPSICVERMGFLRTFLCLLVFPDCWLPHNPIWDL